MLFLLLFAGHRSSMIDLVRPQLVQERGGEQGSDEKGERGGGEVGSSGLARPARPVRSTQVILFIM